MRHGRVAEGHQTSAGTDHHCRPRCKRHSHFVDNIAGQHRVGGLGAAPSGLGAGGRPEIGRVWTENVGATLLAVAGKAVVQLLKVDGLLHAPFKAGHSAVSRPRKDKNEYQGREDTGSAKRPPAPDPRQWTVLTLRGAGGRGGVPARHAWRLQRCSRRWRSCRIRYRG